MAVLRCPHCGRYNIAEELAARGFACELCRQTLPLPDQILEEAPPTPASLPRDVQEPPERPRPTRRDYPVAKVCPNCGSGEYKKRRPERLIAFTWDRVCRACETRYTPPTPVWAALVFLLVGLLLVGLGFGSLMIRLLREGAVMTPAMACEGFLAVLGVFAIAQGVCALIQPGKV